MLDEVFLHIEMRAGFLDSILEEGENIHVGKTLLVDELEGWSDTSARSVIAEDLHLSDSDDPDILNII